MDYFKLTNHFEEPDKPYNIISVCVFRLKESYKNPLIYVNGLNRIVIYLRKLFPKFFLRIHYDSSILENDEDDKINDTNTIWKPFFDKLKSNKLIQLVEYNIPIFRVNKIYHEGTIGMMVRFIPLFKLNTNKNINNVIIMDIDIPLDEIKKIQSLYLFTKKINVNLSYFTFPCYELNERYRILNKYLNINDIIIGFGMITSYKFPVSIFNKFINLVINEDKIIKTYIDNYYQIKKYENLGKLKNKLIISKFPYGLDEVFLLYVKEYINKKKLKHCIFYRNPFLIKLIVPMYDDYINNIIDKKIFETFIKNLLGKFYNKDISFDDNFIYLKDIFYNYYDFDSNKVYLYIFNNLKKNIENLIKNNTYSTLGIENINDLYCVMNIPKISDNMYVIKN